MAIGTPVLRGTVHDTTNQLSYNWSAATPSANVVLYAIFTAAGTNQVDPNSVAGWGLTWTQRASVPWNTGGSPQDVLFVYSAVTTTSPGSGNFSATWTSGQGNRSGLNGVVVEVSGADEVPSEIPSNTDNVGSTTRTATFANLSTSNVAIFAAAAAENATQTLEGGWTQLDDAGHASPNRALEVSYQASPSDLTPSTTGGSVKWAAVAIEVAATAAGTTAVGKTVQALFNVRATAGQSRQAIFNVRSLAAKTLVAQFNVRALATKSVQALFNVRSAVAKTLQARWNVLGALAAVGKTLQAVWNVRASAGVSVGFPYHVRALVTRSVQAVFNARTLATRTVQALYDVRATAGTSLTLAWSLRSLAGKSVALVSNVRATVGRTIQAIFNVRFGEPRNLDYYVGAPESKWDVGTPEGNWKTGPPEPKWEVEGVQL